MPFYRWGVPGKDTALHIRMGKKGQPKRCMAPREAADDPKLGEICGRMASRLCDARGCDMPICDLHATKGLQPNIDFCPAHTEGQVAMFLDYSEAAPFPIARRRLIGGN